MTPLQEKESHWSVNVSRNGESLVTIESNCLSGKPEFTDKEAQIIRDAAAHLMAFIGKPRANVPICADGWHRTATTGYGHQRCVQCGHEWDFYPPKPEQQS